MSDEKITKLGVHSDKPTAIASKRHGSNLDAIGFNLAFIAARNPKLAVEIIRLYSEAHELRKDDSKAPDEDFALFADELAKALRSESSS